jgi:hypothetical protein
MVASTDTSGPAPGSSEVNLGPGVAWSRSKTSGLAFSSGSAPSRHTRGASPARSDPVMEYSPGAGHEGKQLVSDHH